MHEELGFISAHKLKAFLSDYLTLDRLSCFYYGSIYYAACIALLLKQKAFKDSEDMKRACLKKTGFEIPQFLFEDYYSQIFQRKMQGKRY